LVMAKEGLKKQLYCSQKKLADGSQWIKRGTMIDN
jgi:hypothetical protein